MSQKPGLFRTWGDVLYAAMIGLACWVILGSVGLIIYVLWTGAW